MGRIPQYQADRLASSLVGTPGEDRSGQIIGDAVSQAAGRVEQSAFSFAVKRQRTADAMDAQKRDLDAVLDADMYAADADARRANYSGTPEDWAATERAGYEDLFKKHLDKTQSPGARRLLESQFVERIAMYTRNEFKKAQDHQAFQVGKNYIDIVNNLATQAQELGRDQAITSEQRMGNLQFLLSKGENAYKTALPGLNPQTARELVTFSAEAISKATLSGLVTHNPEEVLALLASDNPAFKDVLSPEERTKFREGAITALPMVKERMAMERLMGELEGQFDLMKAITSGDPDTLRKIEESTLPDESKELARNTFFKNLDGGPVEDDWTTTIALMGQVNDMFDKDKKGKPEKINGKMRLQDFKKVFEFAAKAVENRQLKPATAKALVDSLFIPYYEQVKRESTPPSKFQQGLSEARGAMMDMVLAAPPFGAINFFKTVYGTVTDFLNRNNLPEESKGRVYTSLINSLGGEQSAEQAQQLARNLIQNEVNRISPGTNMLDALPAKTKSGTNIMTIQPGPGQAKADVKLTGSGLEYKHYRSKDGKTLFRVTYRDGKPIDKRAVADARS